MFAKHTFEANWVIIMLSSKELKERWSDHFKKRIDEVYDNGRLERLRECLLIGRRLNFISEQTYKEVCRVLDEDFKDD